MEIAVDDKLAAEEMVALRQASGWDHDLEEWAVCLKQNLLNVSARDEDGKVIGVGFLCGNIRHAELIDLVVHPDYRKRGVGRKISEIIIDYAIQHKIKYFGLTY